MAVPQALITPLGRLGVSQSVAYTATAGTVANPFDQYTVKIRVVTTSDARIRIGNNPTADTTDAILPALKAEYFICAPGQKISAVQLTAGGSLTVTECL